MRFIDWFAGVGGFRRGMELAGHNGEWYANDIRCVRADDVPDAECWCFAAPCQDFSLAGKRAGLDGDRGHHTAIPMFGIDYNIGGQERQISNTVTTRNTLAGVTNIKQDGTAVCIPVLTPDRAEKRQNGRRFKDNGEESFTLTSQDRHGVAIQGDISVPVIWYDKYKCYIAIRKLTPRECFRLQGWEDKYFDRAQFVNSDSQLYKQAGNGVTVAVVEDIAKAINTTE